MTKSRILTSAIFFTQPDQRKRSQIFSSMSSNFHSRNVCSGNVSKKSFSKTTPTFVFAGPVCFLVFQFLFFVLSSTPGHVSTNDCLEGWQCSFIMQNICLSFTWTKNTLSISYRSCSACNSDNRVKPWVTWDKAKNSTPQEVCGKGVCKVHV